MNHHRQILLLLVSLAAVSPAIAGNCSSKPYNSPTRTTRVSPANSETSTVTAPRPAWPVGPVERAPQCHFNTFSGPENYGLNVCFCANEEEHDCIFRQQKSEKRQFIDRSRIEGLRRIGKITSIIVILPGGKSLFRQYLDRDGNPCSCELEAIATKREADRLLKSKMDPILDAIKNGIAVTEANAKLAERYCGN
jgi:hypothetical protein